MSELVDKSPCVHCGYNGAGFFQTGTHAKECPFYLIGGREERIVFTLRARVAELEEFVPEMARLFDTPTVKLKSLKDVACFLGQLYGKSATQEARIKELEKALVSAKTMIEGFADRKLPKIKEYMNLMREIDAALTLAEQKGKG